MNQNQNFARTQLLQKINEHSFAVYDMLLYLDTHPCDQEAMAYYQKHLDARKKYMEEYARTYGPLTMDDAMKTNCDTWQWMEQPFPWEKEGACR